MKLTSSSDHRNDDGSSSGRALDKNGCQDADHQAGNGVGQDLV